MIDFQRIRQSTDIETVATRLALEVRGEKAYCPFHRDHTPSLSFRVGRFKCFGSDASGDLIDLVARIKDIRMLEAVTQITTVFHLDGCAPMHKEPLELKEPYLQETLTKR